MDNNDKIICQLAETYFSSSSSSTASAMSESSNTEDSASSSSGDGEGDNDLLLFPLMLYLTSGRRRQRIKNYLQIIDSWTDQEYKQHLRLNRYTASKLLGNIYIVHLCLIVLHLQWYYTITLSFQMNWSYPVLYPHILLESNLFLQS